MVLALYGYQIVVFFSMSTAGIDSALHLLEWSADRRSQSTLAGTGAVSECSRQSNPQSRNAQDISGKTQDSQYFSHHEYLSLICNILYHTKGLTQKYPMSNIFAWTYGNAISPLYTCLYRIQSVQGCGISNASEMEIMQYCNEPLIYLLSHSDEQNSK